MKAVVKSTSNGELLRGQSRAELRGNAKRGVETCAYSYRVVSGKKHGAAMGKSHSVKWWTRTASEPITRTSREGIVRSSEQSETHGSTLQTRDVQ